MTGRTAVEVKNTMKESTNQKGDRLVEDKTTTANGTNGDSIRGGILLERSSSKLGSLKREADLTEENTTKNGASPRLAPSALAIERVERPSRGRVSKNVTPIVGTFAESSDTFDTFTAPNGLKIKRPQPRSRMKDQLQDSLSPTGLPVKRSHKKGAGLAAQAAAMHAKRVIEPAEDAASSMADGEQEEEEEEANGDEEIYCYCQRVSFGEMVACDARDCPREWFHLGCVGLDKAPGKNSKSILQFEIG